MKKIIFLCSLLICGMSNAWCQIDSLNGHIPIGFGPSFTTPFNPDDFVSQPLPEPETTGDFRRLYFIHGLGGDRSSWTVASDACWDEELHIPGFLARNCFVTRLDYTHSVNGTLNTAAYQIRDDIRLQAQQDILNYGLDPARAIIFGHSQGGVVGRTILHLDATGDDPYPWYGLGYGGFVNVTGPLQGAKILNNRHKIQDMAEDACRSLIKGPESSNFWIDKILQVLDKDYTITNGVCNVVSQQLLPTFFSDYYQSITADYCVDAPFIDELNRDSIYPIYNNLQKISAYAVEDQNNLFWRTANWLIHNPNDAAPFEANDDWDFYNTFIHPAYQYYKSNYLVNEARYENSMNVANCTWWIPLVGLGAYLHAQMFYNRMLNWQEGVEWFDNADDCWKNVIGAKEIHINRIAHGVSRILWPEYGFTQDAVTSIYNYLNGMPVVHNSWQIVFEDKLNDGIVLAESAADLTSATHTPIKIYGSCDAGTGSQGSSHMQVRNDCGFKEFLNNLFNGNYGTFFQTSPKQQGN